MSGACPNMDTPLPPLKQCGVCGRSNRAQQRRGMCHACYERRRSTGLVASLVSARSAREHIEVLRIAGWNYREIARAAHIDRSLIAFIVGGRAKINADTAFTICAVDPSPQHRATVRRDSWTAKRRATQRKPKLSKRACSERARKAWVTRRANAAAAEAQRQRQLLLASSERAAEQRQQQQVMAAKRAEVVRRREARAAGSVDRVLAALNVLAPEQDWRDDALCAQIDPDLWFPEKGGSTAEAKKTCRGCPVREQCLEFALEGEERFGIWGGLSERERRRLAKGVA